MAAPLNNDGTGHGPCLGDYPHIGADAHGFYVTTNEYAFFPNFVYMGAQIYAFSKAALASGAANVAWCSSTRRTPGSAASRASPSGPPSRRPNQFATGNGGTEYFMSSDAGDEAQCNSGTVCTPGTGTSTDILVWSLTNTSSLASATPALSLSNRSVGGQPVRRPTEVEATRIGHGPDHDRPAGLLHQRHDNTHHRGRRLLAAPVRCRAGPRRGHLAARLERLPDAAGHLRERQAVGSA